jgi:hypothetical protein
MATPASTYKSPTPNKAPLGKNGYPQKDVKTSGIVTRGNGAATKGRTARGPMA